MSDPAPVNWEQLADMLYHAIHCADDNHRIEAESAYWKAKEPDNDR